jgi:hypothetical protein
MAELFIVEPVPRGFKARVQEKTPAQRIEGRTRLTISNIRFALKYEKRRLR